MGQLDRSGAPDLGLLARLTYGYVLSNADVLTPVETSFVLIASLIPQDVSNFTGGGHSAARRPCALLTPNSVGEPSTKGTFAGCIEWRRHRGRSAGCQRCSDKDMRGIWNEETRRDCHWGMGLEK